MQPIDLFEVFLYLFPLLEIIIISLFYKPFLHYKTFKLSVTDVTMPILLLGVHLLSVRLLTYSLLPHYILLVFALGLLVTLYFDFSKKTVKANKVFSVWLKIAFIIGFIMYYAIIAARLVQRIRG